jgi:hypothetical protein
MKDYTIPMNNGPMAYMLKWYFQILFGFTLGGWGVHAGIAWERRFFKIYGIHHPSSLYVWLYHCLRGLLLSTWTTATLRNGLHSAVSTPTLFIPRVFTHPEFQFSSFTLNFKQPDSLGIAPLTQTTQTQLILAINGLSVSSNNVHIKLVSIWPQIGTWYISNK